MRPYTFLIRTVMERARRRELDNENYLALVAAQIRAMKRISPQPSTSSPVLGFSGIMPHAFARDLFPIEPLPGGSEPIFCIDFEDPIESEETTG